MELSWPLEVKTSKYQQDGKKTCDGTAAAPAFLTEESCSKLLVASITSSGDSTMALTPGWTPMAGNAEGMKGLQRSA